MAMDDNERQYLRRQIQQLTRANRWWKTLTILVSTAFAILLLVQAVAIVGFRAFSLPMERQARMEAEVARAEAEYAHAVALQQAKQAEDQTRRLKESGQEGWELLGYPAMEK
jgi:hypothetical protein